MDTWERIVLFLLSVLILTPAYWLLRFGIRIGAKRAVKDILEGFRAEVPENKGDDVLDDEVTLRKTTVSGWYPVMGSGSVTAEMQIEKVGRLLGRIGYHAADNERNAFGDNGEVEVRMKRDRLARIALLADDGYWLNVDPRYDGVRSGQRFSKAEAERTADILEDFDRAVARPFMGETAEEKERFNLYENRLQSIFSFYG
jgi:hypothetical protein